MHVESASVLFAVVFPVIVRWPVVADVARVLVGRGALSEERGQTLEDPTHRPGLAPGRRALQTSGMELQLYGQALLPCVFVVSCL